MSFWAYMLHCRGGVLYTGHTEDLDFRIAQHKNGALKGFTSGLLPLELVWSQEFPTRHEALAAERQIKGWSRKKKLALIRGDWDRISTLAKGSGGAELRIAAAALDAILAHAAAAAPEEACGLLLGAGGRIAAAQPAANVAADKVRHFEIDPQALIDAHRAQRGGGAQLIGYYHSHPQGLPEPSATDRAMAAGDGKVWAIAAGGAVRFWRDGGDGFEPLSPALAD